MLLVLLSNPRKSSAVNVKAANHACLLTRHAIKWPTDYVHMTSAYCCRCDVCGLLWPYGEIKFSLKLGVNKRGSFPLPSSIMAHKESGGTAPPIPNLSTRWRWVKGTQIPLNRRAGGPRSLSGRFEKRKISCPLQGFVPRIVQPVTWSVYHIRYPGSPVVINKHRICGIIWIILTEIYVYRHLSKMGVTTAFILVCVWRCSLRTVLTDTAACWTASLAWNEVCGIWRWKRACKSEPE